MPRSACFASNDRPGRPRSSPILGLAILAIATLPLGSCAPRPAADTLSVNEVTPAFLATRATTDAALATDAHGRVALTWVSRDSVGADLWLAVSRDSGFRFDAPVRLNPRPGSVASFPEGRPLPVFGTAGELAVAWAERRADQAGAVDVMVRASGDGGLTLDEPVRVNDDGPPARPAYHGFPTLTFLPDGSLFAAWLDERDNLPTLEEPSFSSLYGAMSRDGGQTWTINQRLVDSVCACCRPVALSDRGGRIAIAYRNGAWDFRDPALAVWRDRDRDRTFAFETVISADRWKLSGCPAQGPALTWNRPGGGHYAWYTGAGAQGVYLVPWRADQGAGGLKRRLGDGVMGARTPRLAALGAATLIGVEGRAGADTTRRVLALRVLESDGALGRWTFLGANASGTWLAGLDSRTALACWTEHEGEGRRVRVVRLRRAGAG